MRTGVIKSDVNLSWRRVKATGSILEGDSGSEV